jgi:beta-glucosidase
MRVPETFSGWTYLPMSPTHETSFSLKSIARFVQKLAKLSPEIVFGDGVEHESKPTPEMRAFARKLASEGMVLLRNVHDVLPIKQPTKVAVIGPNAKARVIAGGGSANLKPTYVVSPYEGLVANKPDGVAIEYTVGCYGVSLQERTFFLSLTQK